MRLSRHASDRGAALGARPAWVPAGSWRRQDPLARRCCALLDPLLHDGALPDTCAVVLATAYGSVAATQRFVDSIAEHGDAGASPSPFTASVHNAAAGAVSELLGLRGPSSTISQGACSGLAALRWAVGVLAAQRAPAVLLLCGEAHNAWSEAVVAELSAAPWPIGSGCAACLIEAGEGPGRPLRLGEYTAEHCLDGGGLGPAEARLARAAERAGQQRRRAPDQLGAWWPTATLAALELDADAALQLREREGDQQIAVHLGAAL